MSMCECVRVFKKKKKSEINILLFVDWIAHINYTWWLNEITTIQFASYQGKKKRKKNNSEWTTQKLDNTTP